MTRPPHIPPELWTQMVETAAKAMQAAVSYDEHQWDTVSETDRDDWRRDAEPLLAAVLPVYDAHRDAAVREQVAADVYGEIRDERQRAHVKHGDTSMEAQPVDDLLRLAILTEEVGEVAKEFNEARHRGDGVDLEALRKELVQVGAMAACWADNIGAAGVARGGAT